MGFLTESLGAIATTLVGRQIYDSGPKISVWLVKKAARRLPSIADQERREEEWLAHLQDEPGLTGLYHALGSLVASCRMRFPFETTAVRWSLWLIYHALEMINNCFIMRPHARRTEASVSRATRAELEDALDFAITIAAHNVLFQIMRKRLPNMEVDRFTLQLLIQDLCSGLKR